MGRHMESGVVRNQGKSFLQRLRCSLQIFVREGDLYVISSLEPFRYDLRHFLVLARKRAKRFEKDQAFNLFWKSRREQKAHAATEGMTDDGHRLFVEMFNETSEIGQEIFMLVPPARGGPIAFAVAAQIQRDGV